MTGSISTRRILLAAGLAAAVALSSAGTSRADEPTPPPVPANIQAPQGAQPFLMAHAVGTQNYVCLGAGLPWTFLGPQATVFDDENGQVLTHFLSVNPVDSGARATWQHSRDTSTVWAAATASSTDPEVVAAGAIPWLLLRVVGAQAGPDGGDRLSQATYIQRVNTAGGAAPAGSCSSAGARAFVPYQADYVFYKQSQ